MTWTCFHCNETFSDTESAAEHFGQRDSDEPSCRIVARWQQRLVKSIRELENTAQDLLQDAVDMEHDAQNYHAQQGQLQRNFGPDVRSAQDAWLCLDALQGENEALKSRVAFLERHCNWEPDDEERFQQSLEIPAEKRH